MSKPLDGIKVVELATFVAAPTAGKVLAQMGAEVIKIEGTGGDAWRAVSDSITQTKDDEGPIYDVYNTDKKNISLNIKDPAGRAVLDRLIADADIFLTNTRVKALKKLGLDSDTLTSKYPRLIYAYLDGYGQQGPDAEAPGFDNFAFWSRTGFLVDTAKVVPGAQPTQCPTSTGDALCGLVLYSSIMTALYNRDRTGKGDVVHASLFNVAIWAMSAMIISVCEPYRSTWPKAPNTDNALSNVYQCSDGEWGVLVGLDYKKADTIYEILGVTEQVKALGVHDYGSVKDHNKEVYDYFAASFKTKPVDEWVRLFKEGDVVFGRMGHFRDVQYDEQAWANNFLEKYTCVNGAQRVIPTIPVRLDSVPFEPSKTAGLTGSDTKDVLRDMGYTEEQISDMIKRGAAR